MSLATNPDNVKALADQCREQRREIERLRAQVRLLLELASMVIHRAGREHVDCDLISKARECLKD